MTDTPYLDKLELSLVRPYQRRSPAGRPEQVRGYTMDKFRAAIDAVTKGPVLGTGLDAPPLVPPDVVKNLPGNQPPKRPTSEAFKKALAGSSPPKRDEAAYKAAVDRADAAAHPHGYIPEPKWKEGQQIYVARGKSAAEHSAQMRQLANKIAFRNEEAARAIDRAADAYGEGRHGMARGHLDNAAFLLRAAGHHDTAANVEKVRDAIAKSAEKARSAGGIDLDSLGPGKGESPKSTFQAQASTLNTASQAALERWMKTHPGEVQRHIGVG